MWNTNSLMYNKKMKWIKRLTIVALILLIILLTITAISYFFVETRFVPNGDNVVKKEIQNLPINDELSEFYSSNPPINEISEQNFPKNQKITIYSIKNRNLITKNEALAIAEALNFANEPRIVDDYFSGTTYVWNRNNESLIIYSKNALVSYSTGEITRTVNKNLSEKEVSDIAKNAIQKLIDSNEFEHSFNIYLSRGGSEEDIYQKNINDAEFYQVNFSPKFPNNNSYKVVTQNPKDSTSYVWVLPDGTINKIVIQLIDINETNLGQLETSDYSSFVDRLDQATIVNLDNGNIYPPNVAGLIENVYAQKVEIGYLIDYAKSQFLIPIYIIYGRAVVNESWGKIEYSAVLYLPISSE